MPETTSAMMTTVRERGILPHVVSLSSSLALAAQQAKSSTSGESSCCCQISGSHSVELEASPSQEAAGGGRGGFHGFVSAAESQ